MIDLKEVATLDSVDRGDLKEEETLKTLQLSQVLLF